jgi:hypothetical protein
MSKEFDYLEFMKGKFNVTDFKPVDDFYKALSESVNSYVIDGCGEELTQLQIIDLAMRTALSPHHKLIEKLQKENAKLKETLRATRTPDVLRLNEENTKLKAQLGVGVEALNKTKKSFEVDFWDTKAVRADMEDEHALVKEALQKIEELEGKGDA